MKVMDVAMVVVLSLLVGYAIGLIVGDEDPCPFDSTQQYLNLLMINSGFDEMAFDREDTRTGQTCAIYVRYLDGKEVCVKARPLTLEATK